MAAVRLEKLHRAGGTCAARAGRPTADGRRPAGATASRTDSEPDRQRKQTVCWRLSATKTGPCKSLAGPTETPSRPAGRPAGQDSARVLALQSAAQISIIIWLSRVSGQVAAARVAQAGPTAEARLLAAARISAGRPSCLCHLWSGRIFKLPCASSAPRASCRPLSGRRKVCAPIELICKLAF